MAVLHLGDEALTAGVAYVPGGAHVRLYRDGREARSLLSYVDLIVCTSGGADITIDAHEVATMGPAAARAVLDLWRSLEELGFRVTVNFGKVIPLP